MKIFSDYITRILFLKLCCERSTNDLLVTILNKSNRLSEMLNVKKKKTPGTNSETCYK
jgi:hypothetical protein